MGYCTEEEAEAFLEAAPAFEKHLVEHGILLFKYWLTCDQDKQEQRLNERLNNPLKRWKISPVDIAARTRYDEYTEARERMLKATHTEYAPWTIVDFNDQQHGRLTLVARPARPFARHQIAGGGYPLAAAAGRAEQGPFRGARADPRFSDPEPAARPSVTPCEPGQLSYRDSRHRDGGFAICALSNYSLN